MSPLISAMLVYWSWLSASFSTVLVTLNAKKMRRLGSLPLISTLRRQRQSDHWEFEVILREREFQGIQDYIVRLCSETRGGD